MNTCKVCESEFVAKRKDAKYCSPTCRSRATRGTEKSLSDASDALSDALSDASANLSDASDASVSVPAKEEGLIGTQVIKVNIGGKSSLNIPGVVIEEEEVPQEEYSLVIKKYRFIDKKTGKPFITWINTDKKAPFEARRDFLNAACDAGITTFVDGDFQKASSNIIAESLR